MVLRWKRAIRTNKLFGISFLRFENGANRLSIKSASDTIIYVFKKCRNSTKKTSQIWKSGLKFSEMSFVISSRKTEKYLNQFFLQEVDQNSICQILILFLWLVAPPCFLVKLPQILQKVIVFFPEGGGETKTLFWHIWIAQWLKFFRTATYFIFDFDHLGEGKSKRAKSWTESTNFGSAPFP